MLPVICHISLTLVVLNYPESVALKSAKFNFDFKRDRHDSVCQKIQEPLTSDGGTHFNQHGKLWTSRSISKTLAELDLTCDISVIAQRSLALYIS